MQRQYDSPLHVSRVVVKDDTLQLSMLVPIAELRN